jgi:hypothetical protein
MTAVSTSNRSPTTSSTSFSWYLPPTHKLLIHGAELADAVTIAGPKGPLEVRKLHQSGFSGPVLFDGTGYRGSNLPPVTAWVAQQRAAGADRVLLPGLFVPWDKDEHSSLLEAVVDEARISADLDATMVLALDARWLARRIEILTEVLRSADRPIALVLGHPADPLSVGGAVAGLRWLASRIPHLSVLRSDHGAIGAVAFGADHASIGLSTTNRHFATSAMKPRSAPGRSSRVFVRQLIDWFRASEIAGWSAAGANIKCGLRCCNGASLARFLDADLDATWHNMIALADFADYVLNADPEDRATEFLNECRAAAARYGLAGFKGPENPKAQLTGWALS